MFWEEWVPDATLLSEPLEGFACGVGQYSSCNLAVFHAPFFTWRKRLSGTICKYSRPFKTEKFFLHRETPHAGCIFEMATLTQN
jgi:hypothetical protein